LLGLYLLSYLLLQSHRETLRLLRASSPSYLLFQDVSFPLPRLLWQLDSRQVTYDYQQERFVQDRKSTRLNSSHVSISYAVFCLKKKINKNTYYDESSR